MNYNVGPGLTLLLRKIPKSSRSSRNPRVRGRPVEIASEPNKIRVSKVDKMMTHIFGELVSPDVTFFAGLHNKTVSVNDDSAQSAKVRGVECGPKHRSTVGEFLRVAARQMIGECHGKIWQGTSPYFSVINFTNIKRR